MHSAAEGVHLLRAKFRFNGSQLTNIFKVLGGEDHHIFLAPPSKSKLLLEGQACGRPVAVFHKHRLVI